MKFAINIYFTISLISATPLYADGMRETVLRDLAIEYGLVPAASTWPDFNFEQAEIGRKLFESELLSLTQNVSCRSCHLNEFGSADGIPLAHGAGGVGKGVQRINSPAGILARNTLPLWGRGGQEFDVFFWDGKVDGSTETPTSQFGNLLPSNDALTIATHLPPLEFREMIGESIDTEWLRMGDIEAAFKVQEIILDRILLSDELSSELSSAFGVRALDLTYLQISEALASFIRLEFRVEDTKFHRFVFNNELLTDDEIAGGLIFYGRGRCASCHNGPYFSDLNFHSVPFSQFGFGINGFGVDYGRYNITQDPADLYKFRTPPLLNVSKTAPYSHSGFSENIEDAIRAHIDPLSDINTSELTTSDRRELYEKLYIWSSEPNYMTELNEHDINKLVSFLKTLDF